MFGFAFAYSRKFPDIPKNIPTGITVLGCILSVMLFVRTFYMHYKEDENFDVLITSTGIECQIYFKELPSDLETIRQRLKQETYIEQILIKDEFKINGITEQMGDMIISPKEGKHFNVEYRYIPILMASHDSLNDKAQHIFSVFKGPNLK